MIEVTLAGILIFSGSFGIISGWADRLVPGTRRYRKRLLVGYCLDKPLIREERNVYNIRPRHQQGNRIKTAFYFNFKGGLATDTHRYTQIKPI